MLAHAITYNRKKPKPWAHAIAYLQLSASLFEE